MIDIPSSVKTSLKKTSPSAASVADVAASPAEIRLPKKDAQGRAYGTGRRKESIARVWVKAGSGKITVNDKPISDYFGRAVLRMIVNQPFEATHTVGQFDVWCTVVGGGLSGQAGAIRHGLSRALDNFDPTFHKILRQGGFLTRDSRVVERKKYGKKKARRSFQFSKR